MATFIPPRSPHFNGLWETSIICIKHHLHRVTEKALLSFDKYFASANKKYVEFSFLDRSSDPTTLSHFLDGQPLTSIPDQNWRGVADNKLARF